MEGGAIVEALAGKLFEILDGPRRDVRPKLDDHFALGGFDNGDFVHS
jgi:hypothetical protein